MKKQDNPYKVLESRTIYENAWLKLREDKVIRPEGKQGIFGVVTINDGVTILPMDTEGNVYLIQEFQYGSNKDTLLTVSGGIDHSETPLQAAQRELKEETGLEAEEWVDLGPADSLAMIIDCTMHLFLAKKLKQGKAHEIDKQTIKLVKLPLDKAVKSVMENKVGPAISNVLILKADHYLNRN